LSIKKSGLLLENTCDAILGSATIAATITARVGLENNSDTMLLHEQKEEKVGSCSKSDYLSTYDTVSTRKSASVVGFSRKKKKKKKKRHMNCEKEHDCYCETLCFV
jgi:hypothetical protein